VRMQNAGHVNVDSGHGEWPLGMALLQSLIDAPPLVPGPSARHTTSEPLAIS